MNLEEMVANPNHCDKCDTELEVDQIGLCGDCIEEKTYTFAELSDEAKQHARDEYTGEGYLDYDWWDGVYEDAGQVAKILGIEIGTRPVKLMNGKTRQEPAIQFSGFSNQGDGACFEGNYSYNPKAIDEINAYCNDAELIRVAMELNAIQVQQRLLGNEFFIARIDVSGGNYCHSNTINVEVTNNVWRDDEETVRAAEDDAAQQLFRDFADWIYKSLEAEHDWLYSDECVDAALVDETFDESGSML